MTAMKSHRSDESDVTASDDLLPGSLDQRSAYRLEQENHQDHQTPEQGCTNEHQ